MNAIRLPELRPTAPASAARAVCAVASATRTSTCGQVCALAKSTVRANRSPAPSMSSTPRLTVGVRSRSVCGSGGGSGSGSG
jgi:hypothetical protein